MFNNDTKKKEKKKDNSRWIYKKKFFTMRSVKPQSTLVRQQVEVASFVEFSFQWPNKMLEQCSYQLEEETHIDDLLYLL